MHSKNLPRLLNLLQKDYNQARFLNSDPLEFAHRYQNPRDQEAVALLAAVLAYGNVTQIRKSLEDALTRIQLLAPSPQEFVENLHSAAFVKQAFKKFENFAHRFNVGGDVVLLFQLLNRSWSKYGSLGQHFSQFLAPGDPHIGPALSLLIQDWRGQSVSQGTFSYLLTSPTDGSCCKRWCLFLRWMIRKDDVDLGLWSKFVKPNLLIMPLDTHTGRISQYLGLTSRKTLNWKAAVEVTESLKKVDRNDPTRYDFALSRLGILDLCQRSYREEICQKCQLVSACQFAQKFSPSHLLSMES